MKYKVEDSFFVAFSGECQDGCDYELDFQRGLWLIKIYKLYHVEYVTKNFESKFQWDEFISSIEDMKNTKFLKLEDL